MAVQMHGVGGEELVLDHKVVPLVGLAEVDGIGNGGGGAVGSEGAAFGQCLECRLSVVGVDGAVVEEPAEDVAVIRGGDLGDEAGREERSGSLEAGLRASGLLQPGDDRGDGLVGAVGEASLGDVAGGGGREGQRSALVCDWGVLVVVGIILG